MKPLYSVLSINVSFLVILYIIFFVLLEGANYMPPFVIILGMINLMLGGFFLYSSKKEMGWAFMAGFGVVAMAGLLNVYYVMESLAQ